jgi:hypothetical protein
MLGWSAAQLTLHSRRRKRRRLKKTTTDAGMRVLARTVACVCVRPCEAGAVTNYNKYIATLSVWRARSVDLSLA